MKFLDVRFFLSFFRWLNLLSLDVVLIALAWQEVFARAANVALRWEERTFLAISIWIVYIIDHWFDSMVDLHSTAGFFSNKAPRHYYVRSHRLLLGSLLVLASLANVWLLWHLGLRLLIAGMGLAVITLGYLALNHFFLRRGRWLKGREIVISLIFSAGCALVALVQSDRPWLLLPWMISFALVALINCTLIARMERSALVLQLAPQWIFSLRPVLWLFLLLALFVFPFPLMVRALCWSLMGLMLIPMMGQRWGYEVASLAADQALFFGALLSLLM